MVITNAKYHKGLITDEVIGVSATIDGFFMSVPLDTDNRHYNEILKQVDDGTITVAASD